MQLKYHTVTIEDLVPKEHLLRKVEAMLDLSFVYEETAHLYSRKYGRPAIDPVVLVKYLLLGYLYGIPSERQIEERCKDSNAFRWYLGIDLDERVPDHSTISQLRRRKPSFRKVFRRLFERVAQQCVDVGLASGRLVATDSTHVKASASLASMYLMEAPEEPGTYWERLNIYEEQAGEYLTQKTGKQRKKRTKVLKRKPKHPHRRVSRTDPDAGWLNRANKPHGMYYLSHQTLDTDHGIILDVAVTAGDASDKAPYLAQIERVMQLLPIQKATADSAYDFGLAHQVLGEHGVSFFVRPMESDSHPSVEFRREHFQYDRDNDCFRCPNGKELTLTTVSRNAGSSLCWVYSANRADCQNCPMKEQCLNKSLKDKARRLTRSVFEDAAQKNLSRADSPEYQQALRLRQIWCEGTFAIQKWSHNLTRILRRGLEAAEDHCLLSATALNLKRMIKCMG